MCSCKNTFDPLLLICLMDVSLSPAFPFDLRGNGVKLPRHKRGEVSGSKHYLAKRNGCGDVERAV